MAFYVKYHHFHCLCDLVYLKEIQMLPQNVRYKIYDQNQERDIMSKDIECAQAVNFPTTISL